MDLTTLTDDQLEAHAEAVRVEQERRQRLATIPTTMALLATQYRDGGGTQDALTEAIQP